MKSPQPLLWRSLDEAAEAQAFGDYLRRQFPRFADRFDFDRREFLKVMAASMALAGVGACSREPQEKILPYVKAPQQAAAGEPRFFATAVTQGGLGIVVRAPGSSGSSRPRRFTYSSTISRKVT